VKEFPPPWHSGLAKGEHGRAVALVVGAIDTLSSDRHMARGQTGRTMEAVHAAYDRSGGASGNPRPPA
jgi:hypothetical protein